MPAPDYIRANSHDLNIMPLPTCDPWITNTLRQSDQVAACRGNSGQADAYELPDEIFLYLVIDSLQRLAVDGVAGFSNLSQYLSCEGETNARLAYARLVQTTLPIQASKSESKQIILWQLGAALCANNA